jgi:hypothetical protein
MIRTRRAWLQATAAALAGPCLWGARKEFWETKDPAAWSDEEKQILLGRSPWARDGFARMEEKKRQPAPGYASAGKPGVDLPDPQPGVPPGALKSVPIGEAIPPPPKPGSGELVQFHVLARWETAKPVRLAGGPEVPELTGQFYVIRLQGLPLMPPSKQKPGEPPPPDPNEGMLQAIRLGSRLERAGKPAIPAAHLFTGTGNASTSVLLFFPRGTDPITPADKVVTLDSRFSVFHLSIKFPLKEMLYKGELAL